MRITSRILLASVALAAAPASAQAPAKKPVASVADLPRFSYPNRGSTAALLTDPVKLDPLAVKAEADLRKTLAGYAIADRATLRQLHMSLATVARYRRDWPTVRREIAIARSLEDKPLGKATASDVALAYAQAATASPPGTPGFRQAFARAYAANMATLPWSLYGDAAIENVGMHALLNRNATIGGFSQLYQPQIDKGGALDEKAMRDVIGAAVSIRDTIPLKAEIMAADRAYVVANRAAKPDIWAAREVTPTAGEKPVVVAIWDSGVDAAAFPDRLWTNPREKRDGRDDDGNGYVDDVHGIAFDEYGRRSADQLWPVPAAMRADLPRLQVEHRP